MIYRKCGHIRDVATRPPLRGLISLAGGSLPGAISYRPGVDWVRDQGHTGACVGFAWARALHLRSLAMGSPIPYPSARAAYALARAYGGQETLVDFGCSPADMQSALAIWGIPPESAWPWMPERVDEPPDFSMLWQASEHVVDGVYRAVGDDIPTQLCEALAAGHFPTVAVEVDEGWDQYDGRGVIDTPHGVTRGLHDVVIVGYETDANGEPTFELVNSWGIGWGDVGFGRVSAARICDPSTGPIFVITTRPK